MSWPLLTEWAISISRSSIQASPGLPEPVDAFIVVGDVLPYWGQLSRPVRERPSQPTLFGPTELSILIIGVVRDLKTRIKGTSFRAQSRNPHGSGAYFGEVHPGSTSSLRSGRFDVAQNDLPRVLRSRVQPVQSGLTQHHLLSGQRQRSLIAGTERYDEWGKCVMVDPRPWRRTR